MLIFGDFSKIESLITDLICQNSILLQWNEFIVIEGFQQSGVQAVIRWHSFLLALASVSV